MGHGCAIPWKTVIAGLTVSLLTGLAPNPVYAVTGQAKAVQATVLGVLAPVTTSLADTGALAEADYARDASLLEGSIPSLLTGEVLHATTIGQPDRVASEASLGNLVLNVAGNSISADFVMARAGAVAGAAGSGTSEVAGLLINGLPIFPTGTPNQRIDLVGGRVLINEQLISPTSAIVNALHIIVDGVTDVVIASATAGL